MVIITAKASNTLIGFACHFLEYDNMYGHYLDNLHVSPEHRGKGIGQVLLHKSMDHCRQFGTDKYYLWVFEQNKQAIEFYVRQHGKEIKQKNFSTPDGLSAPALLFAWQL